MNVVDNIADEHPLMSHDFFEDDSGIDDLKEQRRAEMKAAETNPEEYIKQAKMAAAKKKAESLIARIKNRSAVEDDCEIEAEETSSTVQPIALTKQTQPAATNQTQPMVSQDSENIEEVLFDTEPQQPASGSKTIIIHNVKKLIIRL